MRDKFSLANLILLCFCTITLMVACNSEGKTGDAEVKEEVKEAPAPAAPAALGGFLDTLYIERAAFDTISGSKKIAYSFVFKASDKVTLAGWVFNGSKFDSLPNMELKNAASTSHAFGAGTYFGDVMISQGDCAKIKTVLRSSSSWKFVLFVPILQGNNIQYKILVSDNVSLTKETILVVGETDALANPSPPKNS